MTEPQLWLTFWLTLVAVGFIFSASIAGYFLGRTHGNNPAHSSTDQFSAEEGARHVS